MAIISEFWEAHREALAEIDSFEFAVHDKDAKFWNFLRLASSYQRKKPEPALFRPQAHVTLIRKDNIEK